MILIIGMGNTNTAIGDTDETKTHLIERVTTGQGRTDTEYTVSFRNILEMHQTDTANIEGAILSSVVPPVNFTVLSVAGKMMGNRSLLMGFDMKTGINIVVDNPKTVGSDQIVDAVAVSHEHPLPLVVVDVGTVTTLCTVNKGGNYIGGVVFSGFKVSLSSPSSKMVQLPYIDPEAPSHVIGKNTIDYMRSGAIYGNADMIDGTLGRMEKELEELPTIIATDGLAKLVTPLCRHKILVDDALLLEGLSILYRGNTEAY